MDGRTEDEWTGCTMARKKPYSGNTKQGCTIGLKSLSDTDRGTMDNRGKVQVHTEEEQGTESRTFIPNGPYGGCELTRVRKVWKLYGFDIKLSRLWNDASVW